MSTLLADIEEFLARHDMAPTRLGADATGDRHLVRQMRSGRRVWPETEKKLRDFMADYSPCAGELCSPVRRNLSGRNEPDLTPPSEEPSFDLHGSYREPELPIIGEAA
jgi:hypothetical protein